MSWLVIAIVLFTTMGTVLLANRLLGLNRKNLLIVALISLECLGLAVVFSVVNVGLATMVVVLARTLGIGFVSAYVTGDPIWLILSFLQAVSFQLWRTSEAR